jgi:hypothetical protein
MHIALNHLILVLLFLTIFVPIVILLSPNVDEEKE